MDGVLPSQRKSARSGSSKTMDDIMKTDVDEDQIEHIHQLEINRQFEYIDKGGHHQEDGNHHLR